MSPAGLSSIVVSGLFFIGMGLVALVRPQSIVGMFGGTATTPASRAEVRAVYGGYGVVVGALIMSLPAWPGALAQGVAVAMAASVLGMALGRIVGALVDRDWSLHPTGTFLAVEVLLAGALGYAAASMSTLPQP